MTDIKYLPLDDNPSTDDWLPLGKDDSSDATKRVRVGSLPIAVDTTGLQQQINSKANATDVAATVSVLQGEIAGKSPQGHTHLPADITGLSQSLSLQWTRRNTNSELVLKTLVDTSSGDLILSAPTNVTVNQEFEIKKIFAANYCKVTGINKINGYSLQQGDTLFFDDSTTQASTTKLIYIDNNVGWLSFPSSAFNTVKPLSIPTTNLKQLLYSGNVSGLTDGQTVQTWIEPVSNLNAVQNAIANRATYKVGIFGNNEIPGILFSGSQIYEFNYNWILNQKFTFCIVERRTSGNPAPILGVAAITTGHFYIVYGNNGATTFIMSTHVQKSLSYSIGSYSSPTTRIWMISNNSREWSIWLNGQKVSVASTANVTVEGTGRLGGQVTDRYSGFIGLIAGYQGDLTDAEIKLISDKANETFKAY